MITDVSNNLMQQALDHFSNHRWAIVDSAIDPFVYELLNREIEIFIEENLMRESTIGKNRARIAEIRSDFLFWHDPEQFTIAQMNTLIF